MNEQPDQWTTANDHHESSGRLHDLRLSSIPHALEVWTSSKLQVSASQASCNLKRLSAKAVKASCLYQPDTFQVSGLWPLEKSVHPRWNYHNRGHSMVTWKDLHNRKFFTKVEWTLGSRACCLEAFSSEFWIPQNVAPDFCRDANIQIQPRGKQTEMVCCRAPILTCRGLFWQQSLHSSWCLSPSCKG